MVASYSRNTLNVFEQMGARSAVWLPFAGDRLAHYSPAAQRESYEYDVSFIGSWRPEREETLKNIHVLFPHLRLRISGPYWNRCSYTPLRKLADSRPLFGKAFSSAVQSSFLNLNVMDDLNYPGVNMRFFEIPMAGGLALCSAAPEMEKVFADREHLLYFSGKDRLAEQIEYAFTHRGEIEQIKLNGQALLMQEHLYIHRAFSLLDWLKEKYGDFR
jgi:spore maturation protein CgeB